MYGPIGWAVALMTMTMVPADVPRPELSRPRIVVERVEAVGCRQDDASRGDLLEVAVTLRNQGGAPTTHLIAWPAPAPGVLGLPAPTAFGAIQPGALATRTVLFAGYGACGRPESVRVVLMDRSASLGTLEVRLRAEEDGRD